MSQVNLLPPELKQRQQVRRLTSAVVVAGVIVLALIGAFYFLQTQRLSEVEDDIATQDQANAALNAQIAELSQFADLQAELAAKQQLVQTLFMNEVSWSSVLLDISRVIPDASYLTNMTGQVSAATGTAVAAPTVPATGDPETTLIGTMGFTGVAAETQTISTWLTRLEEVRGWVNPWVTSASENQPFSRIYTFASGLDLSLEAATDRGQGGVQP